LNIFLAILVFTFIILVHELGHFWAARRAGIKVVEFSIGMGPRIFHFKKGDTIYSLKLFPIGGSCRMLGEDEEAMEDGKPNPASFNQKSVGWRAIVMLGGVIMNFALALILSIIISMFNHFPEATIQGFTTTSPAREAGVMEGDTITRINGRRINVHGDSGLAMMDADGSPITIEVDRDGERITFEISPHYYNERWMIGIIWGRAFGVFADMPAELYGQTGFRQVSFFESFAIGFHEVSFFVRATVTGVGRLFTHDINFEELVGPIGIVDMVGSQIDQAAEAEGGGAMAAFWTMLRWTVLLSANLGVLNLLPLPALDGGRLVFLAIEAVRKKPLPPEKEGMVHFIGFAALMVLVVIVAFNDISRFFN